MVRLKGVRMNTEFLQAYSAALLPNYVQEVQQHHLPRRDRRSGLSRISEFLGRQLLRLGNKLDVPADDEYGVRQRYA